MIGIIKITTYRYLNLTNPNQLTPLACHFAYKHILKSLKCIFTANKNHFHSNKTQKNEIITKITLIYMHCKWTLRRGWADCTLERLTFSTSLSFHAKCERSSIHSFFRSVGNTRSQKTTFPQVFFSHKVFSDIGCFLLIALQV